MLTVKEKQELEILSHDFEWRQMESEHRDEALALFAKVLLKLNEGLYGAGVEK